MPTISKSERESAMSDLRERLSEGETVYCILRHVSRSGMFRIIDLVTIHDNEPRSISWLAAKVLNRGFDMDRYGLKVTGAGMDMGFECVYSLSRAMFEDGYALSHRWL